MKRLLSVILIGIQLAGCGASRCPAAAGLVTSYNAEKGGEVNITQLRGNKDAMDVTVKKLPLQIYYNDQWFTVPYMHYYEEPDGYGYRGCASFTVDLNDVSDKDYYWIWEENRVDVGEILLYNKDGKPVGVFYFKHYTDNGDNTRTFYCVTNKVENSLVGLYAELHIVVHRPVADGKKIDSYWYRGNIPENPAPLANATAREIAGFEAACPWWDR